MSWIRSGLRLVPDELDQVIRLARFRERHPDVIVGDGGFGTMQARIPEPDGETVVTRYTLRELLDKLGELLDGMTPPPEAPTPPTRPASLAQGVAGPCHARQDADRREPQP